MPEITLKFVAKLVLLATLGSFAVGGNGGEALAEEGKPDRPEPPALKAVPDGPRIEVEEASTRVMIAKVHLNVGTLRAEKEALVGNYALDVPLMPGKSEGGTLRLPLKASIEELLTKGGKLRGTGTSFKEDKPIRKIIATIYPSKEEGPKGELDLEIDVGNRVIEFETRYHVRGLKP